MLGKSKIWTPALVVVVSFSLGSAGLAALVSHWTFDDAGNVGADSGPGMNDGILFGNATQGTSLPGLGSALLLDGDGDYVNVGGNASFEELDDDDNGWTLAGWVNTSGNSGVQRV